MAAPVRVHLVCGAPTHDTDLARLELLKALGADPDIRTTVAADWADRGAIAAADGIVVYTCNAPPDAAALDALEAFFARGGRLFALHASNALIRFTDGPPIRAQGIDLPGQVDTTDTCPRYTALIGSRFVAHLLLGPVTCEVAAPGHPLVAGLPAFTVEDEPYVLELTGPAEVLLTARFAGSNPGYVRGDWDAADRPQMYLAPRGEGAVLYCALGHASGRHDLLPLMADAPVSRGPWDAPEFREILARAVRWLGRKL